MVRKHILTVLALVALVALAVTLSLGATQTITGVISDDMCAKAGVGNKHTMVPKGKSDADCVRECVKAGGKYVLFTPDKKVYALKGDMKQFDQYAAKNVTLTGDVAGNTMTVKSLAPAK